MTDALYSDDYHTTLRTLAARRRFGERDRLGTANLIDSKARLRAVGSVKNGTSISLSRQLEAASANARGDRLPVFALDVFHGEYGEMSICSDHVEFDCHGHANTHLDGFNHMGLDGTWYGNWPVTDATGPSLIDFRDGLLTRGVLADIPAVRGTEWVSRDEPVTDDDLERAIRAAGVKFEPGDALLLYMGRDRFEVAGEPYFVGDPTTELRPGVGRRGAEWITDHNVSVLAWDFMDANLPTREPPVAVHMLLWAIGLVLVDNCDFRSAVSVMRRTSCYTGAFVVAPLVIGGATGCNVNPLLIM